MDFAQGACQDSGRYGQGVSGLGWASADWFGDEGYVDDHFKVGSFLSIEVRHFLNQKNF